MTPRPNAAQGLPLYGLEAMNGFYIFEGLLKKGGNVLTETMGPHGLEYVPSTFIGKDLLTSDLKEG